MYISQFLVFIYAPHQSMVVNILYCYITLH